MIDGGRLKQDFTPCTKAAIASVIITGSCKNVLGSVFPGEMPPKRSGLRLAGN